MTKNNSDTELREKILKDYLILPGNVVRIQIDDLISIIAHERQALLTEIAEKAAKKGVIVGQLPPEARSSKIRGGYYRAGFNSADDQWRTFLKELADTV